MSQHQSIARQNSVGERASADQSVSWKLRRRCVSQAGILLSGLGEVCGAFEEGAEIARRSGMAAARPFLPFEVATIAELESKLNDILMTCEWGYVHVTENEDCLSIALSDYPVLNETAGASEKFVYAFMEGFVGACVAQVSDTDELALSIEVSPVHMSDPLIFRFGPRV